LIHHSPTPSFAVHASDELAAEALLDQFNRAVRDELEGLKIQAVRSKT
jgi:hypothetical protein